MDNELKTVCEQFISSVVDSFVSPLSSFLDKIDTLAKLAEEEGKEKRILVAQQPFTKPGTFRFMNYYFVISYYSPPIFMLGSSKD